MTISSIEEKNKTLVLDAFEMLCNKRDYAAAERYWSPNDTQHNAHIPPGQNGLFELVKNSPATLKYENQLILANGGFLMLHGQYSGLGPAISLPEPTFIPSPRFIVAARSSLA